MVLFRSAVKQIAAGMAITRASCAGRSCRTSSSGWHLHQSLLDRARRRQCLRAAQDERLIPLGRHYLARPAGACARGRRVHHADHQRLQALPPYSLAPDRAIWAHDNRGVMVRVLGGPAIRDAAGEPRRRARRQSLSLHGLADVVGPRRHRPQARSRAVGRHALRDQGRSAAEGLMRRSPRCATIRSSATRSATASSITTCTSRRPRSRAFSPK